ncbi:MAG: enoyl-CoA hydratase/isomerase family protein [Caulobacterales bacterium]
MADIVSSVESGVGRLTLNRPAALHALTHDMCAAMIDALLAWRADPSVKIILIDHAGERGFCAGGDIRMLADSGKSDGAAGRAFFHAEYRLNHLLMVYGKPIVALIDGVTMGGGVGISLPAQFRVSTERTTFSMPESGIGLFPDVGGGWHLPRLPGKLGLWLALTGARLKAADCVEAGLATHFVTSARLAEVRALVSAAGGAAALRDGLDKLHESPGAPIELTAERRALIDELFSGARVEDIFAALAAHPSEWAQAQLSTLKTKCPMTLKVSYRQLAAGAQCASFAENMKMEYRLGARIILRPDFHEGVRAVIIDKDNAPRWSPSDIKEIEAADLDAFFAPLPDAEAWTPLPELAGI